MWLKVVTTKDFVLSKKNENLIKNLSLKICGELLVFLEMFEWIGFNGVGLWSLDLKYKIYWILSKLCLSLEIQ